MKKTPDQIAQLKKGHEKKMAEKLLAMHKGELKKSSEEAQSLMKSYVEERVKPLEDKLSTILDPFPRTLRPTGIPCQLAGR